MKTIKPVISYDDFYKLDLRVAKIVWAGQVDGAERLFKLTLDEGTLGQRTVMAPLRPWYQAKKLLGKRVIYLANTKFKKIGGIKSEGSVLTVAPLNPKTQEYELTLIMPDKDVPLGSIVR